MVSTTVKINVDKEAWEEVRRIVFNLSVNPKLVEPLDISDAKVSIYLNRILNEFLKQNKIEYQKVSFTREY